MITLGIDPGPETSGVVLYDASSGRLLESWDALENTRILEGSRRAVLRAQRLVIEDMHCYGQMVGQSVLRTAEFIGAVKWAYRALVPESLTRPEVCYHFCDDRRAKQTRVRHVLRERHGGQKVAVGRKDKPGPLYGIKGHAWEALAVALAWIELQPKPEETR